MSALIHRTVLIVGGSLKNRELYRRYLLSDISSERPCHHTYSYSITEASSGAEGLKRWQQNPPDALLLDCTLSDFEGSAFIAALPDQKPPLPIVMMAEMGREAIALQSIKAGAQDYLIKEHLTPERLQLTVSRAIQTVELEAKLHGQTQKSRLDQEQSAGALKESELRFGRLAENLNAVLWIREEPEGRVSYLSAAYERLWGWSPQALYNDSSLWIAHIHPGDRDWTTQAFLSKAAAGEFDEEYRIVLDDGTVRWVRDRCVPVRDQAGQLYRFTGIAEDITERVEARAALQQSEEFKNRVLESSSDCIKVLDLDAQLLYMNAAGMCLMEIEDSAPYLGASWLDFWQGDHWQMVEAAFVAAKAGEVGKFRGFCPTVKGKPKWWDVVLSPIRDRTGRVTQILSTARDVSDRKQAQVDLQAQAKLLQTIISSIGDGLVAVNQQREFTIFNAAAQRMFGPLSNDEPSQNWSKAYGLYLPDQQTLFPINQLPLFRAIQGEAVTEEVFVRRDSDSEGRWISVSGYPLVDADQAANGGIIVCQDITQRKRTEEELQQKNAILDAINQFAPIPIFVKDRCGRIIYANPATLSVLGKSAAELLGHYDVESHPSPEHAAKVIANDQRVMASGQAEVVEESPDGIRTFLGTKAPYRSETGEVIGLIGISNDITERVQIERDRERIYQQQQAALAESERVNQIKDEFLAVLSHELRSPLNPILGWAKLLQTRQLDEVKTRTGLETIERNAKAQCQLIDDLLDMARVLRGKLSLSTAPVEVSTAIEGAIDTVQTAADAKSIQIQTAISEVGPVSGDIVRLQQIVWNLLTNAIKFTPSGGRVEVALTQVDSSAQISVTDSGKGISPDFLPHIFESFRQQDASITRHHGGLGLGMAIVYQLVEAHGGTITAASAGANQGSTFTVRLPLLDSPSPAELAHSPTAQPLDLTGIRALVIDDEPDSLELLLIVLTQAGAEVLTATSATEFMAAISSFQPTVMVSDIGMPGIDGYTLIQQVRALPPAQGSQVLAIALTAYAGESDRQQAIAAGFDQHVAKPIEPNQLVAAIVDLLARQ